MEETIYTWEIHSRINLHLFQSIPEAYYTDLPVSKGRNIWEQFVHIHNIRMVWLKGSPYEHLKGLHKIAKEEPVSGQFLALQLEASAMAIAKLLKKAVYEGSLRKFKPQPSAFAAYLISHESYHHGQIILALKQSGHPFDKKALNALWDWGLDRYPSLTPEVSMH